MKALVIGSGVAGLATSIRLATQGYAVEVYEANSYPGGKLTVFEQDGFRFDAGPSLFTLPHLVDELFALAGENPRDHFNYQRSEVACHYFFEDGVDLMAWSDPAKFAQEVEEKVGVPAATIKEFFQHSQYIYDTTTPVFLERSLHRFSSYLHRDVIKGIARIFSLDLFTTMDKSNRKRLKEPHLVQLFNRFATYNGSNPFRAPGVLNTIPHLEHHLGTWFPEGGMHAITQSLYALAQRLGVRFHFNQKVTQILTSDQKVLGIEVGGKQVASSLVVSNMDIVPTYRQLMPTQPAPEKTLQQERSSSAIIFYWGIQHQFSELQLHNIFFSADYQEEFRQMFEDKTVGDDPTVYIHVSSRMQPEDAPEGCDNWFVMVNAPSDQGQDWDALIPRVRQNVLRKLSRLLKTDIEPLIKTESLLEPRLIRSKTSSFGGALYGSASNDRMAAFLRHANFSGRLSGLYFCGGSVHPGGGIPLCLLSARIVSDLVQSDLPQPQTLAS